MTKKHFRLTCVLVSIVLAATISIAAMYVEKRMVLTPVVVAPPTKGVSSTPSAPSTDVTANWGTYTNPEDFYSIQYPNRGKFFARYTAKPKRTILDWENLGDYDVEIYFLDAYNLTLQKWLAENTASTTDIQTQNIVINGANGVTKYLPSSGTLSAYLEYDIDGFPFIYQIDFVCFDHGPCPPPFWQQMLNSFRILPANG